MDRGRSRVGEGTFWSKYECFLRKGGCKDIDSQENFNTEILLFENVLDFDI